MKSRTLMILALGMTFGVFQACFKTYHYNKGYKAGIMQSTVDYAKGVDVGCQFIRDSLQDARSRAAYLRAVKRETALIRQLTEDLETGRLHFDKKIKK
jgi:hypothetical protein